MSRQVSRRDVYAAIDSERAYQAKWGDRTHTVAEYILYMEEYLAMGGLRLMPAKWAPPIVAGFVLLTLLASVLAATVLIMANFGVG